MTNCPICINGMIKVDDVSTMTYRTEVCSVCNGKGKLIVINVDKD